MSKCNMSEEQVLAAYDVFYEKHPSGEISQVMMNDIWSACKSYFQTDFVNQSSAGIIAESLFRVFDEDKSGQLSFYEFLQVK